MKFIFFFLFLFSGSVIRAQSCPQFPADCADDETLQQMAEKRWEGPTDLKVKEEYLMQDSLRRFTLSLMQQIAKKNNWRLYPLIEDQDAGIGIDDNTKPLPYPLRRPCPWGISFVFIVNEDSLHAWQNWYNNELKERADNVVAGYKQTDITAGQNYTDSATYYGNQKTKYMTDHAAEYQKALLGNDQKVQKKFEDEMKRYDDKINAFIGKANGKNDEGLSPANSRQEDLQAYKKRNTIAYRNASMIRVQFSFNEYTTAPVSEDVKIVKPLAIPDASLSVLFHNKEPDPTQLLSPFLRSSDFALLLYGKWVTKLDEYNSYDAVYKADKKANDAVTVKKIPCDKVQTITTWVEGSIPYINRFLQSFDPQKINSLIEKE